MIKNLLKLFFAFSVFGIQCVVAQTVTGTVTDAKDNSPVPGVSVILKGTSKGTSSDFDGNFSINVSGENPVLLFSSVGYKSIEIPVNGKSTINVSLEEDAESLDEVVVTALGIKRERKSLGYSVQEVKGVDIVEAREQNVANALSGKVTGLRIIKGSNGPASSSKIVLRGFGSLTGNNQPLIVIDGIPMDNFTGAENNGFWDPSQDLGNGLGDINSDDIENISVLKGASAAALYGSRAGNGVILITTKTGKAKSGLGITYSSTLGISNMFITPELQSSFGQGSSGVYDQTKLDQSSWGEKIEGQTVKDYNLEDMTYKAHDNLRNFYKSGFSQTHTISFQQMVGNNSSLYSSASYLKDKSNIPGAKLDKLNLMLRGISKFGDDKWTLDTKVQYVNINAKNRPINGANSRNSFSNIALLPRTIDVTQFRNPVNEYGNMNWYQENTTSFNPYWLEKKYLSEDYRDRFLILGALKREFTDWLSAEVKLGTDLYTTNTETKIYSGSPSYETGKYNLGKNTFMEKNLSALVVAKKDNLFGKVGGMFTLGGNLMSQKSTRLTSDARDLTVPDFFSLRNSKNGAVSRNGFKRKKINSLYGLLQLNYDQYLFLDITGRNDWSSALSKENRSFFYPSFSTSLVVSDMLKKQDVEMPNWLTFAKLRASYAEVGNDLDPYRLINGYRIGNDVNQNTTATTDNVLFNPDIKNELIRSVEFGLEGRFFNNRLSLDATWYKSNAFNQIIDLPMDPLSGYNFRQINAGDIENKGIEISLRGDIIKNDDGLNWITAINYTKNKNFINKLDKDVEYYPLGTFDNLAIRATVGGEYGEIRGTRFKRVEDKTSPFYGRMLLTSAGLPEGTSDKFVLGSQQPDALIGFTNVFTYKNVSFSFLIDASLGGEIFSGTNRALQASGNAAVTVVNGERKEFVVNGVVSDGNGGFVENTALVTPQQYWGNITGSSGNLGINEANIYDATNVRLRTLNLNYRLPKKFLEKTFIENMKLGISATNVWMIKSNLNGIDPESVFATGSNAIGFENLSSPTTRNVFFNIAATF